VKFGVNLGLLHPSVWSDVARAADGCGFESIWLPEHLVFPVEQRGELRKGEPHAPVPPSTPLFDAPAYLCFLAAMTQRARLGTFVYLLGLRHPFIAARAFATLDVVSNGRAEVGIGVGWCTSEFEAAGVDPATRGRRLDECADVCARLWSEREIEHRGEFYSFERVMFEPKPVQRPHPPFSVGGESPAALRRAVRLGGWIGMEPDVEHVRAQVVRLRALEREAGIEEGATRVTVPARIESERDVEAYARAGAHRLIPVLGGRSRDAVRGVEAFAERYFGN